MQVKLYVGNLDYAITEAELRVLFARAGGVDSVEMIKDRSTGQAKGFAFVTMNSQDAAQKAIGQLNGFALKDRQLTVNVARPKEKDVRIQPERGGYVSKLGGFTLRDPSAKTNGPGRPTAQRGGGNSGGYQSHLGAFGGSASRGPRQRGNKGG
jgi:RNA recognition motif-containing protein